MKTFRISHFTNAVELMAKGHILCYVQVDACSDRTKCSPLVYVVLSNFCIREITQSTQSAALELHAELTRLAPDASEFYFEDENTVLDADF